MGCLWFEMLSRKALNNVGIISFVTGNLNLATICPETGLIPTCISFLKTTGVGLSILPDLIIVIFFFDTPQSLQFFTKILLHPNNLP